VFRRLAEERPDVLKEFERIWNEVKVEKFSK
jgi:hypothetical protein